MKRLFLAAICAAACQAPPEVRPPPFGEDPNTRLFYPTGIVATPPGDLVIANGNFDHSFDASTMVTLRHERIAAQFQLGLDCGKKPPATTTLQPPQSADPACDRALVNDDFLGAVIIGNYAGPLAIDTRFPPAGAYGIAYAGSRDDDRLNRVVVQPGGALGCLDGSGDCRATTVDMRAKALVEGPYAIVPGVTRIPGETADRPVLYVSSMSPHIDVISNGIAYTSATVGVFEATDPTVADFAMLASTRFTANGAGVGPMVFDPARRQLIMSGCYQRSAGSSAGEPTTTKCGAINNLLRVLDVDAAATSSVRIYDLLAQAHSVETGALELGVLYPDGSRQLWATMRQADALVEILLPADPSLAPQVVRAVPLPITPSDLKIVPRAGQPSLIAVAASRSGSVVIYDPSLDQVVAQVERLGDTPWKLELLPAADPANEAWLAASVFGSCRVALVHLPLAQPWKATLAGRLGICP